MGNYYPELYFGSIHILVAIVLFCSLLLWSQRGDGQRSRHFLVWTLLILLVSCAERLVRLYGEDVALEGVLPIGSLVLGVMLVAVMTIYPIEVITPWWLNRKRSLLLFSPVILVLVVCGYAFIPFFIPNHMIKGSATINRFPVSGYCIQAIYTHYAPNSGGVYPKKGEHHNNRYVICQQYYS